MPKGARIVLKSKFLNANKNASGGSGTYAQYIGTREGAVIIGEDRKNEPASESQEKIIKDITDKIPESKESLEYYEYERSKTIGTANSFITNALDEYGYKVTSIAGYAEYMATRPGVVEMRDSGLFSFHDTKVDLNSVKEELKNYPGNIYLPIISLRPEDSIGYGYDNPGKWQELIEKNADAIAKEYHIQPHNLKWVGAYHHAVNDEGVVHNHVHLMVWSKDPSEGWQTKNTGTNIKKILAKDIFKQEYTNSIEQLGASRDELRDAARAKLEAAADDYEKSRTSFKGLDNADLVSQELFVLAEKIQDVKGRKYYRYMSPEIKQMVDNIMNDMFEKDPQMKEMLNNWKQAKENIEQFYNDTQGKMEDVSPCDIEELRPIKNAILQEANNINKIRSSANFEDLPDFFDAIKPNTEEKKDDKEKRMEEKYKGLNYKVYTAEEAGGSENLAKAKTSKARTEAYRQKLRNEQKQKLSTRSAQNSNNQNSNTQNSNTQHSGTNSQDTGKQFNADQYARQYAQISQNKLMANALGKLIKSVGSSSGSRSTAGQKLHVGKTQEELEREREIGIYS